MECKLVVAPLEQIETDAVAVVLFEDSNGIASAKAWLDEMKASGEFGPLQYVLCSQAGGWSYQSWFV